jgi:hypothetical protein
MKFDEFDEFYDVSRDDYSGWDDDEFDDLDADEYPEYADFIEGEEDDYWDEF